MVRRTVFVPLIQVVRSLGLPRDWLNRQIAEGRIPHLQVGRDIYLHYETVVESVIDMMKSNVTDDSGLTVHATGLNPVDGPFTVRGAAPFNFDDR